MSVKEFNARVNKSHRSARGIVGCWRFNRPVQTVRDLSGFGFDLSVTSGTLWANGAGGWLLRCDSSLTHTAMRTADQCANFIGFPFSIRIKGNAPAWAGNPGFLVGKGVNNSTTDSWFVWTGGNNGAPSVAFQVKNSAQGTFTARATPDNYDFLFSVDVSGNLTSYQNGIAKATHSIIAPVDSSTRDFRLGSDGAHGNSVTNFNFDTIILWNREVTSQEARGMALNDKSLFCLTSDKDY